MKKITGIRSGNNKKRAEVFIDGELTLTVHRQVILEAGLRKGQDFTETDIENLKKSDLIQRCSDAALNFLSYRPRSEKEVRQRLIKRGFDRNIIEFTIDKLKQKNLINDSEFAKFWLEDRSAHNPKAKYIIKKELRIKGINDNIATEAVNDIDENDAAYRAAEKKARALTGLNYDEYYKKLYNYLKWRGFNYEIINNVCDRLWELRNRVK